MKSKYQPDLSSRPHQMHIERQMSASASDIYKAWTEHFDWWFAEKGEVLMAPEIDTPWFFNNRKDWGSHAHYGRFVELEPNKLIVTTWLTGPPGTAGDETLIRIELTPNDKGTFLKMTHSGFSSEASCKGHIDNWPEGLAVLDECLSRRLAKT